MQIGKVNLEQLKEVLIYPAGSQGIELVTLRPGTG